MASLPPTLSAHPSAPPFPLCDTKGDILETLLSSLLFPHELSWQHTERKLILSDQGLVSQWARYLGLFNWSPVDEVVSNLLLSQIRLQLVISCIPMQVSVGDIPEVGLPAQRVNSLAMLVLPDFPSKGHGAFCSPAAIHQGGLCYHPF